MSTLLHVILDRAPALTTLAQECKGCPGTLCKGCHGTEHEGGCPYVGSPYCAGSLSQRIERTTPPSALRAAPFVAEESGLQRNTTRAATSSGRAKRRNNELGRTLRKNSASNSALVCFEDAAIRSTNSFAPSEAVGPGNTVFTVTPVPAVVSAKPREIASCAVFVMP